MVKSGILAFGEPSPPFQNRVSLGRKYRVYLIPSSALNMENDTDR